MSEDPSQQAGAGEDPCAKPREYDLSERTARFGESIVRFARKIRLDPVTSPPVKQLVRSGTSVGANYCEANEAGSKKEFRYRISVCMREAHESKFWLRIIAAATPSHKDEARRLWREAHELNRIFSSIFRKTASKP
jgi:four helix bundle protein